MDATLAIDILKFIVPSTIAFISLVYAIKQRSVANREISKKRRLEDAQTNLSEVIETFKKLEMPRLSDIRDRENQPDEYSDARFVTEQLLRDSFDTGNRKIELTVKHYIRFSSSDKHDSKTSLKDEEVRDFTNLDSEYLENLYKSKRDFFIESGTEYGDFRPEVSNSVSAAMLHWRLESLWQMIERLSKFEDVYDAVSPNSVSNATQLFEDTAREMFSLLAKPRIIVVELDKFAKVEEITDYLFENSLNYSGSAYAFNDGLAQLISQLKDARKALFLKIV